MTKLPDSPEIGRRLRPSNDTSRISDALAQASASIEPEPDLLALVELTIHSRSLRARYIPPHLLGEPVWDMLLELLRAELLIQTVTRAQLCAAAGLPHGVAERWVEVLVENGLCRGVAEADDQHIQLASGVGAVLRDYFAQLSNAMGRRS